MKPRRVGSWFVTAPVAALGLVYIWFGFLPGHRVIAELQEQVKSKQQLLEQSQLQGQAMAAIRESLAEAKAYVQKWRPASPSVQNMPALCGSIHQLANDARLTTTRFDPQPPQKKDSFSQVPITIQAIGTFSGVYGFLTRLEGLPFRVWVESVSLTMPEKLGQDAGKIAADIKLVVFINNPESSDYVNPAGHPIN